MACFVTRYTALKNACLKAQAEGKTITEGIFAAGDVRCPIEALRDTLGDAEGHFATIQKALDVSRNWIWAFVDGFDNNKRPNHDIDAYCLGQCLRAEFIE